MVMHGARGGVTGDPCLEPTSRDISCLVLFLVRLIIKTSSSRYLLNTTPVQCPRLLAAVQTLKRWERAAKARLVRTVSGFFGNHLFTGRSRLLFLHARHV